MSESYYERNKEMCREKARIYYHSLPWLESRRAKRLFTEVKCRAKRLGIEFDIDKSDLSIPDTCPILGIDLYFSRGKQTDNAPSVDRINPSKGYIKGNVQVISLKANRMKNNGTLEELVKLGKWAEKELNGN